MTTKPANFALWLALGMVPAGIAAAQDTATVAEVCVPPTEAPPPFVAPVVPPPPSVPKCLNLVKHTSTCSQKIFDAYNAGIDARNEGLQKLVEDGNAYEATLNDWSNSAITYRNCRVKELNAAFRAAKGAP